MSRHELGETAPLIGEPKALNKIDLITHCQPQTRCQAVGYCFFCMGVGALGVWGGCELLHLCLHGSHCFTWHITVPAGAGVGAFSAAPTCCGFFCCSCPERDSTTSTSVNQIELTGD